MKIECKQGDLRKALALCERSTGRQLPLPVLSAVLLEAVKGEIIIRSTNLELGIEYTVSAKVLEPGKVAVLPAVLSAFVASSSDSSPILIETREQTLLVKSDKKSAVIKTVPSEDFPNIPRIDAPTAGGVVSAELLRAALASSVFACAQTDIKPEIASVALSSDGRELRAVATDSFRLAEKKIPLGKNSLELPEVLVPARNAVELLRIFDGLEGDVTVSANEGQLSFTNDALYVTTRLIDGSFPDLSSIFPKETATEARMAKQDLLGALKLATVFSDKFNRVGFRIDPEQGVCEVSTRNGEQGESTALLEGELTGKSIEVFFNSRYILESFQAIPTDTVWLGFTSADRPLVLRGVGDTSFTYLVMPLHG